MDEFPQDYEVFDLGDVTLQHGATLRDAKLAYKTYGELSADKSNAIVYPTWYSGRHWDNEWLIGDGMALDPGKYFIIVPNMLGNGLSSSPSNTPPPYDRARFPDVRVQDNVRAQHRLVTEHFGIDRLVAVTGWSMGAGQTYPWAVSHPEMVPRIMPFCGSARTAPHNFVFLEGVKGALTADSAWKHGWYDAQPTTALPAFPRVYTGWVFSQSFYWDSLYTEMGSRSGSLASRLRTRCTAQCWRSEAGQHCSMALISPGAPSATISIGAPRPRAIRSRPSSSQSSWDSRIPSITDSSTRSPASVNPHATRTPSLGPSGRTERKTASRNSAATWMS